MTSGHLSKHSKEGPLNSFYKGYQSSVVNTELNKIMHWWHKKSQLYAWLSLHFSAGSEVYDS